MTRRGTVRLEEITRRMAEGEAREAHDQNGLAFGVVEALVDRHGRIYLRDEENDSPGAIAWSDARDGEPVFTTTREGLCARSHQVDGLLARQGSHEETLPATPARDLDAMAQGGACGRDECLRCQRIARGETCAPACAGFYIDEVGVIRKCEACGLHGDDDEAGIAVERLLAVHDHDGMLDGWEVFVSSTRGYEIERDDEAGILSNDADAWPLAIAKLGRLTGCNVGPRPRVKEAP